MPKLPQKRRGAVVGVGRIEGAQHCDDPVLRRAELVRASQASGRSTNAFATARRSPFVSRNTDAIRSTAAFGGSSATKCLTSFVATKRAVDGWRANDRIALSPSSTPSSAYRAPRTVLVPGSCNSSLNANPMAPHLDVGTPPPAAPPAAASADGRQGHQSLQSSSPSGFSPARGRPAACTRPPRRACATRATRARSFR